MRKWRESMAARIGLRLGGVALYGAGWSAAARLHHLALTISARDTTSAMMLLAAIVFLCGSAGSALLFVGPGLWDSVEVSGRWRPPLPDPAPAGGEAAIAPVEANLGRDSGARRIVSPR
jgi:hypothetical protein